MYFCYGWDIGIGYSGVVMFVVAGQGKSIFKSNIKVWKFLPPIPRSVCPSLLPLLVHQSTPFIRPHYHPSEAQQR